MLVGAESTGKTTLAGALADIYGAPLVQEFSREYLKNIGTAYLQGDLLHIARGQWRREQAARFASRGLLFVDTDMLVIRVWSEVKYGGVPAFIDAQTSSGALARRYILTRPDIPWTADPLRENPNDRAVLHSRYRAALAALRQRYVEVGGTHTMRVQVACGAIERWRQELSSAAAGKR